MGCRNNKDTAFAIRALRPFGSCCIPVQACHEAITGLKRLLSSARVLTVEFRKVHTPPGTQGLAKVRQEAAGGCHG